MSSGAAGGLLRAAKLQSATLASVMFSCPHWKCAADHTLGSLVSDAASIRYSTYILRLAVVISLRNNLSAFLRSITVGNIVMIYARALEPTQLLGFDVLPGTKLFFMI